MAVSPPPPPEQLAILSHRFPALRPLLPAALATLRLARLASGQGSAEPDAASTAQPAAGEPPGRGTVCPHAVL